MKTIGKNFTAVVVARNEHNRLPFVLQNFACLENVLVVDNYSTDDTCSIAEKFGRRWIQVSNQGGFVENDEWMKIVWAEISTPYMLLAACAESLPLALLEKYNQIANDGSFDVARVQRVSISAGKPIPIDLPPRWLAWRYLGEVRFFKKDAVCYVENEVHSRGKLMVSQDRILYLPRLTNLCLYQFRDYDSSETENKLLIYNDLLATQRFKNRNRSRLILGFLKAIRRFLLCYILYGGFRFGFIGFMHCYYRFHMEIGLVFRAYEHDNNLTKPHIIKLHQKLRNNPDFGC